MPIYEYECGKCGVIKHSQRISDAALTKCPRCRRKVKRLISSTSFQLKGTGWYATDYPRAGAKKDAKDGETKSDTKSGSTSESSGSNGDATSKSESKSKADTKSGSSTPATTAS